MELAMNVLNIVRKQAQKRQALEIAQIQAAKSQAPFLVYRGVAYTK
tara:strand:+ start:96 stop:233 length:138 start_codon:yes stop_codon:yes gene_type:complete